MYDTITLNNFFTKKLEIRINVHFNNEHKIALKKHNNTVCYSI